MLQPNSAHQEENFEVSYVIFRPKIKKLQDENYAETQDSFPSACHQLRGLFYTKTVIEKKLWEIWTNK